MWLIEQFIYFMVWNFSPLCLNISHCLILVSWKGALAPNCSIVVVFVLFFYLVPYSILFLDPHWKRVSGGSTEMSRLCNADQTLLHVRKRLKFCQCSELNCSNIPVQLELLWWRGRGDCWPLTLQVQGEPLSVLAQAWAGQSVLSATASRWNHTSQQMKSHCPAVPREWGLGPANSSFNGNSCERRQGCLRCVWIAFSP